MVVPTVYGFDADHLYVHGSAASRSLTGREPSRPRTGSESPDPDAGASTETDATQDPPGGSGARTSEAGGMVCVTVTHVDGLVLARSVFEHGVNYRSAMIYGVPRKLEGEEKPAALRILTEHSAPGQWDYARQPSRKELAATTILAISLAEASVKMSSGPPDDGEGPDAALGLWAGVLPLATTWLTPIPDPLLPEGATPPDHIGGRAGTRLS